MNLLITTSGGPDNPGLKILREAARSLWRSARTVILTGDQAQGMDGARSTANPAEVEPLAIREVGETLIWDGATVSDVVDLAYLRPELFLTRANAWDFVLIGLDPSNVMGAPDMLRHPATAAGMLAATAYGAASLVALHQGTTPHDTAWQTLLATMRINQPGAGETMVINLPAQQPRGVENVPLAHYSSWRLPPTAIVPRAREENTVKTALDRGSIAVTRASLRLNPQLRY